VAADAASSLGERLPETSNKKARTTVTNCLMKCPKASSPLRTLGARVFIPSVRGQITWFRKMGRALVTLDSHPSVHSNS
jgi:hypothetical protein